MTIPGVLAASILLGGLGRMLGTSMEYTPAVLLEMTMPYIIKMLFIAYPLVTKVAFDAFSCYKFADREFLKADVAIECGTAEHDAARALAWIAIFLYPVGLLMLNAALLFAARRAILTNRPTALSRAISFL